MTTTTFSHTNGATRPATAALAGAWAGAWGAAVMALGFLGADVLLREAFWTPSVVGSLVLGIGTPGSVDLSVVAAYSLLHAAAFFAFGALVGLVAVRLRAGIPSLVLGGFLVLQVAVGVVHLLTGGELLARLGQVETSVANLLAATATAVAVRKFLPKSPYREENPK